jgi:hypothetical protein
MVAYFAEQGMSAAEARAALVAKTAELEALAAELGWDAALATAAARANVSVGALHARAAELATRFGYR